MTDQQRRDRSQPRRQGDVRPDVDPCSAEVRIDFLKYGRISEICALLTPLMNLLCGIVWWNELM
jgi:hypothetical protein